MSGKEPLIGKIKDGTVIDHITAGNALEVLKILGITGHERNVVSIALNVQSKRQDSKDILKIEGRELSPREVDAIALVAPRATINIIRNFEVISKKSVKLPRIIKSVLRCPNSVCVTNSREPVKTIFHVEREDPVMLRCYYCNTLLEERDIPTQF